MIGQEPLWRWDAEERPEVGPVEECARAYVGARLTSEDSSGSNALAAAIAVDAAWHDLAFAVLGHCRICDPGTCPCLLNVRQRFLVNNAYRPIVNTPPL